MLLPDNIHPELCIYYNGALILQALRQKHKQTIIELYSNVKNVYRMSFSTFILGLDWLYLLNAAEADDKGWVQVCL